MRIIHGSRSEAKYSDKMILVSQSLSQINDIERGGLVLTNEFHILWQNSHFLLYYSRESRRYYHKYTQSRLKSSPSKISDSFGE